MNIFIIPNYGQRLYVILLIHRDLMSKQATKFPFFIFQTKQKIYYMKKGNNIQLTYIRVSKLG